MATNTSTSIEDSNEDAKRKRKIKFLPLPSTPKLDFSVHQGSKWSPRSGFRIRKSLWMWIAIAVLFVANILYAVAFLTNRWGVLLVNPVEPVDNVNGNAVSGEQKVGGGQQMKRVNGAADNVKLNSVGQGRGGHSYNQLLVSELLNVSLHSSSKSSTPVKVSTDEKYWEFGLWECCRNDGFCLGTRWPAFYSATRAFAVLGLFGQILTLAWMIGYALDNLLEYDPCSMIALLSLNIVSAVFVLLAVCAYGTRWPVEFRNDFHGTDTYLSYSFYLAVDTFILLVLSSGFITVDLVMSWRKLRSYSRKDWATADEILGDEDEDDGIEEQSFHKISYM